MPPEPDCQAIPEGETSQSEIHRVTAPCYHSIIVAMIDDGGCGLDMTRTELDTNANMLVVGKSDI